MYASKRIGVLGGGQLGRMLIQAAIDYDLTIGVLDPSEVAPSKGIAHEFHKADFNDFEAVLTFGRQYDIVTIEIENVNIAALYQLEKEGIKVFPQPRVLEIIKNKRIQKSFYLDNDIPTAPFTLVDGLDDIKSKVTYPTVNKLGEGGYDGRGVQVLRNDSDLKKAFKEPSLLEELIPFDKELAVIVARNEQGDIKTFPTVEMAFHPEANLVEYLFSPALISDKINKQTEELAKKVVNALDMVGLLAVEMFLTNEGHLLVNEVAPRPHNSGHHTIRANMTSQYEQHLRAICNLPLGETTSYGKAAMVNILGAEGYEGDAAYEGMEACLAMTGVYPFLYGKKTTKPFRKMGHTTIIDDDFDKLIEKVNFVKNNLISKTL